MTKMTKKEINELKRKVKKETGRNMKDVTIRAFGDSFIEFGYYKTNYDKVTSNMTTETITR